MCVCGGGWVGGEVCVCMGGGGDGRYAMFVGLTFSGPFAIAFCMSARHHSAGTLKMST